jgi:hypothetical protein
MAAPIAAPGPSGGYAVDAITTGICIAACSGGMLLRPMRTMAVSAFVWSWRHAAAANPTPSVFNVTALCVVLDDCRGLLVLPPGNVRGSRLGGASGFVCASDTQRRPR